ncbi:tetratricopeptide repeat protein [Tepidicella baoligensis]|uniref:tetratricopeptide repeat protein n=1 Tax=Tepidicella baoligensis TaxID=2707016 RepID=UPI001FEC0A39|nr:tetratricopeptide repeat protein [Tepidicella baoligensis]
MSTLLPPLPLTTPNRPVHTCKRIMLFAALSLWLLAGAAWAQDAPYDRVHRLLQAGELPAAWAEAEAWLARQPRDPQMRFFKGVIQQQRGEADAARQTFVELTRDYPELPEPYNNLAVLHAAAGQLGEAREALEMAIRLNPQYAIAHRNLGDVYLLLAANAYRTSLQYAPGVPETTRQLQGVEQLLTPSIR